MKFVPQAALLSVILRVFVPIKRLADVGTLEELKEVEE